jgi:hypothetical protein
MILKSCLAVLLIIAFGQSETQLPSDFATLQKISMEELKLKADAHRQAWGMDKSIQWDLLRYAGRDATILEGFRARGCGHLCDALSSSGDD